MKHMIAIAIAAVLITSAAPASAQEHASLDQAVANEDSRKPWAGVEVGGGYARGFGLKNGAGHPAGYGFNAAAVDAMLSLMWPIGQSGTVSIGPRFGGHFTPTFQDDSSEVDGFVAGARLCFGIESTWLWGTVGIGVFRSSGDEAVEVDLLPELHLAGGLNIPVSERIAFRIGASLDTLVVYNRLGLRSSLQVRF